MHVSIDVDDGSDSDSEWMAGHKQATNINNNNGKIITPQYTKIIRNMGMRRERQHPAPPMVGNLMIVFDVVFPTELTEEQMKTISECL